VFSPEIDGYILYEPFFGRFSHDMGCFVQACGFITHGYEPPRMMSPSSPRPVPEVVIAHVGVFNSCSRVVGDLRMVSAGRYGDHIVLHFVEYYLRHRPDVL